MGLGSFSSALARVDCISGGSEGLGATLLSNINDSHCGSDLQRNVSDQVGATYLSAKRSIEDKSGVIKKT